MTASIHAPWGTTAKSAARPLEPRHAVGVVAALVILWAVWAALFNTAQFGDNIEQFNWAQSLELGYHKHPPLPSWALGLLVRSFGPSIYWAYLLATMCLLATAAFTWGIGRQLLGDRVAAAAIVLWGLNLSFSQRVQLYNHNTVLVVCMAATVWCAMRGARSRRAIWWVATGLAAGAALLSKYQAVVPLAGLVLALGLAGHLRRPDQWRGIAIALGLTLLVVAPHVVWVTQHDFSTLRYAADAVQASSLNRRIGFIASFVANQLRMALPALVAIAVCVGWARWQRGATGAGAASTNRHRSEVAPDFGIWMFGLIAVTLIVMATMALLGSVSLRNHWGVQALQFSCLWIASQWDRRSPIDLRRLVTVAVAIQALSLAAYAVEHRDSEGVLSSRRLDTMYPARRLALTGVAHWRNHTGCPLRYVAGTVFDAGLVSLYSGGQVEVFDTASATPWVSADALARDGALYILAANDALPAGVTDVVSFSLGFQNRHGRPARSLRLGILMPQQPCHEPIDPPANGSPAAAAAH